MKKFYFLIFVVVFLSLTCRTQRGGNNSGSADCSLGIFQEKKKKVAPLNFKFTCNTVKNEIYLAEGTKLFVLTGSAVSNCYFCKLFVRQVFQNQTTTLKSYSKKNFNDLTEYTIWEEINLQGKRKGDKIEILVEVTDLCNTTVSEKYTIFIGEGGSGGGCKELKREISNGQTYNFYRNQNAWDLRNNQVQTFSKSVSSSCDLINVKSPDFSFRKEWQSENGTQFALANSLNYHSKLCLENVKKCFSTSSPSSKVSFSNGSIIIAKLRGQDEFVVIKITEIKETSPEDNNDYIKFVYKKL